MKFKHLFVPLLLVAFISCAYVQTTEKKELVYAPVEASLCHINQKVANHYLTTEIPNEFNEVQYKAAVNEVCSSNPKCLKQAQTIFDSYAISVRKVGDMFSVMLCDKEMKWKIMEDFSCNNIRVEVQSWKNEIKIPCKYEENWERVKQDYCND